MTTDLSYLQLEAGSNLSRKRLGDAELVVHSDVRIDHLESGRAYVVARLEFYQPYAFGFQPTCVKGSLCDRPFEGNSTILAGSWSVEDGRLPLRLDEILGAAD